jgi:phosphoribosylanthranilate isomerase
LNKRVKICGITNFIDAQNALEAGASALGFVFYEQSPRYISVQNAKEIIDKLPPFIEKVGLFVNLSAKEVNKISSETGITLAQIHFEASENFYKELAIKHVKVIRAKKKEDILKYNNEYRLVDAFVQSYGGEGKRVELSWFDSVDCSKIILAGGLNSDNVAEVLKYNFYALDLSSGVEKSKGKKDKEKMISFMEAVIRG